MDYKIDWASALSFFLFSFDHRLVQRGQGSISVKKLNTDSLSSPDGLELILDGVCDFGLAGNVCAVVVTG